MIISVKLQVIESPEETLLLETDWLKQMKAKWDFDQRTLQICYKGRCIKIGTTHLMDIPPQLSHNKPMDEQFSNKDQILNEIEYESEDDIEEQKAYISDLIIESDDENPAVFLSTDETSIKESIKKPMIGIMLKQ